MILSFIGLGAKLETDSLLTPLPRKDRQATAVKATRITANNTDVMLSLSIMIKKTANAVVQRRGRRKAEASARTTC